MVIAAQTTWSWPPPRRRSPQADHLLPKRPLSAAAHLRAAGVWDLKRKTDATPRSAPAILKGQQTFNFAAGSGICRRAGSLSTEPSRPRHFSLGSAGDSAAGAVHAAREARQAREAALNLLPFFDQLGIHIDADGCSGRAIHNARNLEAHLLKHPGAAGDLYAHGLDGSNHG